MAAPSSGLKAWASPPASRSTPRAICTLATAAGRFSRSARAARFLSSPRSNLPSPRITWRFIPAAICTFPGRRRAQRLRHCGHGAPAIRPRDSCHHRLFVHARLGRARLAIDRIIEQMKAEIIAVGSELLTPDRVDTNSLFLTEELNKL